MNIITQNLGQNYLIGQMLCKQGDSCWTHISPSRRRRLCSYVGHSWLDYITTDPQRHPHTIFLIYSSSGPGHYDTALPYSEVTGQDAAHKELNSMNIERSSCRCGVNKGTTGMACIAPNVSVLWHITSLYICLLVQGL